MKLKKYSLVILSILLILLVFVSSASAADSNGTDILSIDESTNNEKLALDYSSDTSGESNDTNVIENNENNLLSADNDESGNVLRDGTGTFAELQTEISTALSSGDYVKLTKDTYTYAGSGSQIEIGKSCTIDGNGAVIDMANSGNRAFFVMRDGVTIKNLTIKNANFNGNGGAIYFSSSGTVENCNFINNTATNGNGGAIYFYYGSTGTVTNCNFTNNSARYGGAIYFEYGSTGNVTNCNFAGNKATGDFSEGGAIWMSSGSVTNCNFTGNNATTGSAIYFYWESSTKTISNSIFLNNRANSEALEVIKNENNITITFTGNDNLLNAIYSRDDAEVSFTNVTYWGAKGINNTGSSAIKPSRSNKEAGQNITVEIYDSNGQSVDNVTLVTDENGQVTYDLSELSRGKYKYNAYHLEDSYYTYAEKNDIFTIGAGDFNILQSYINAAEENSVLTLDRNYTFTIGLDENLTAGIVIDKKLTINGNGYTINALQKARIFKVTAANVVLNNITFANATYNGDGGAIYFSQSGTVENCNFTDNQATGGNSRGGAVYFEGTGTVTNCNFTNNQATGSNSWGGAVYMYSGSVTNCNFTGNKATGTNSWGGAVYFDSDGDVTNCNFTNNKAAGDYSYGGAIMMGSGSVTNCNFTGNTATGSNSRGGAINIGSGTVSNCNFTDNQASLYGGAIRMTSGSVENCNFTDNQASLYGGAVYCVGTGNVTNCNFTNNKATGSNSWGGAVYFENSGSVTNCNFTGNTANYGGAITMGSGSVTNCNFTANQATGDGGAIWMSSGTVTNCNFTGNTATRYGGAVYFLDYGDVTNCNFINNTATNGNGGAIWMGSGSVTNCNFTGNTATANGGAVYFLDYGDVTNCNFTGNTATANGGAVYIESTGDVRNCNFTNNKATGSNSWGGAVYMYSGSVTNCNFTANQATGDYSEGGAIWMSSGTVTNCNFTGNNATTGSAIYFYRESSTKTVSNSIFLNNRANSEVLEVIKNENNITITFTGNDNLLNAIYSNGEVSFTNVTYWGANGIANTGSSPITPSRSNKEAGQNITVSIVINNEIVSNEVYVTDANGRIVLNRNVGDNYFIGVCHDTDSYYTEKVNTTSNNTKFNVNVTSQTTNNKTVNITAKSNIPNEVIKGKLLFILPNSTEINATYASNGTWWALHTFDDAGDYNINATYIGLDDVIINNATIRIMNVIPINTSDISISFGDIANVIVYVPETINGQNITITVNKTSKNATVKNGEAKANFTNLPTGKHLITADYLGDDYNCANSTNATLTVSKRPTEISLKNKTIDLFVKSSIETGATLIPANAGNLTYTVSNPSIAIVENGKIKGIKQGKTNITVSFAGNENYTAAENKTISVTVNLNDASITVNNETLNLKIGQNFTIIANTTPEGINVTYVQDDSGVYIVDKNGVVTALKNGTGSVLVKIGGDGVYAENSTIVNVTVTKLPTEIKVTNTTLDLKVDGEIETGATLIPADAGNLTYTISNPSIVKIEDGKIIALKEGNATITVSFEGNKKYLTAENKTINVTVSLNDASVKVNNNTLNLLVDESFNLIATTEPKDLTVNYTSSNPSVVTVDNKGNVIAVSEGNATITVTVGGDGKYVENSTTVTVTVSKVPTEITLDPASLDLLVGDETVIAANLTPPEAGNLTFTSSDENIVTVDNQGNVIAEGKGQAIITISFAGDNKYAAAENKTITVTVSLNDASVTVDNNTLDLKVDETYKINATKHPDTILLDITYTSSDETVATVDKNGVVTAVGEGTAIINLEVGDDEIYAKNSTAVTVTVSKIPTEINIENTTVTLNVGDEVSTGTALNPEKAGNLTYKSNDESIAIVKDGKIIALKEGDAIITVSFAGDNKYAAAENKTIKVTVKKLNPIMDVSADEITEGENATISVTLPGDATGNVTAAVNGKTYSSKVKDGKAVITIPDLKYGNYTIPVNYSGDDKYNPSTKDVNLTVKEDEITVSAPDLTQYYSGPEPFIVNVTYARGVPAADKEVKITINGVTYIKTTDENGIASLSINLNSKTYDVTTVVDNITVSSIVTILPTIEAEDIESKSKNIVFTATFLDSEGKYLTNGTNVSFNIGGVIYNSQISGNKGLASIDLILDRGRYTITSQNTVTYENAVNSIAVDLKDADMIISGDEITVGENATISTTLPSDATGNVTAKINGKTYMGQVKNGKATITIPDLSAGNYTASVTYSGDYNYNSAKGDANITVNKINASMTVDAHPITAGENATVTVTLPSDATGNITIGTETVLVKDGAASAVLTDLPVGTNTVPVTYSGDDKYNPTKTNVDVVVNEKPTPAKENLTIKASAEEITEGENATVIVTGLENATGNVSTNINGKTYTSSIEDGKASITVPGLTENVTAVVNYPGDDKYNPAITTVNITVNRNTVTINAQNLTKNYKDPQKFTVNVTDAKGQAAPNKTVEITINGVTYKRITDENGTASLNINLGAGEYPVSVAVDDVTVNSTVTVKSTIDASDVVKMFRNDTQYYATFTGANGTPLANTMVSFNINGVIYNRTTDANGTAKMNINMGAGDYIITATNPVTGEMKSNSIKVISLIESDDLTKYYKNASQFVVRIHSADGGYVGAGEEVTFNINGVFYTRTTNATGHAKLNINLPQGNYTITTYYKDCSQGNEITVLPVLSADDLVMKYRDGSQFKAKLVDGQGKAYPGQSVQFNINGMLYNRVTGSDGIAKLNINLMSGEYIITSSYNGANIANKITIRG